VPEITQSTMVDPTKFMVASLVIIAITMVIATLSYRWLEAPIMLWARRFEQRRRQPAPASA
jgi:peptidoglycan/LPS O-acetylase OafA/YrhL